LRIGGQSIIEYLLILVVVAIASMLFAKNFLYDSSGKFKLFVGYVDRARELMQ